MKSISLIGLISSLLFSGCNGSFTTWASQSSNGWHLRRECDTLVTNKRTKHSQLFMLPPPEILSRREWIELVTAAVVASGIDSSTSSSAVSENPTAICDPAVSTWENRQQGRTLHIVGTAHISSVSADLAADVVREIKVCGLKFPKG